MSRHTRVHWPGGVYYVVWRRNPAQPFFRKPRDYKNFERPFAQALEHCGAVAYGYCLQPCAIHVVVRMGELPVSRLLQSLWGYCADSFRASLPADVAALRLRPQVGLIDARTCLVDLVHYLHWLPVLDSMVTEPGDYHWTSHAAYLGRSRASSVDRELVFSLLAANNATARRRYVARMKNPPASDVIRLFQGRSRRAWHRVHGPQASEPLTDAELHRREANIWRVHLAVAKTLGIDADAILSQHREHTLVFARAWIAVRVVECGIAPLEAAAHYLGRTPDDLRVMIRRYRKSYPLYFDMRRFPVGGPLLSHVAALDAASAQSASPGDSHAG